jgi:uncharacterized protein
MIIEVAKLVDEPMLLEYEVPWQELKFAHDDAQLCQPVGIKVRMELVEELTLRIQGGCRTVLEFTCSRCLQPFSGNQDLHFDLFYIPASSIDRKQEEIELREEDLEVGFYDGIQLDLNQVVSEQLVFAVPMKPLCGVDCRGLCPQCGNNLNQQECGCQVPVFSPWQEQLKQVKEVLEPKRKLK